MRIHPTIFLTALYFVPLSVAAAIPAPLSVLSGGVDASAPLSLTVSSSDSNVLSSLQFGGQYFACRSGNFGRGNVFSLRCTEKAGQFGTPRIEVLKNGKRHAFYENVFDGSVSVDGKYLALQNATAVGKNQVKEQVRIIEIATKSFKRLPLVPCTQNVLRWSQAKLITSSYVIYNDNMPGHIEVCAWDVKGKLLARVQAGDLATGTTERPINRIGFLPSEVNSLYVLVGMGSQPGGQCILHAIDLLDPSRTVAATFDPELPELYNCSDGFDSVELDLQDFTLKHPSLRFRAHRGVDGYVGPWKTVVGNLQGS